MNQSTERKETLMWAYLRQDKLKTARLDLFEIPSPDLLKNIPWQLTITTMHNQNLTGQHWNSFHLQQKVNT